MYGVPSGVVWDPGGDGSIRNDWIEAGFLLAAADVALALPPPTVAPTATGTIVGIWIAPAAGERVQQVDVVRALAGRGLAGDRHVAGAGTFPSGVPGSALTLVEAEVCESFDPPLGPDEHRRNLVTRGIDLNGLVGHEFRIGATRFRGMRLCEPCTVVDRYASRSVLRELVHRGGLRADILEDGEIRVGDQVQATTGGAPPQPSITSGGDRRSVAARVRPSTERGTSAADTSCCLDLLRTPTLQRLRFLLDQEVVI